MAIYQSEIVYLHVDVDSLPFFQAMASKVRIEIIQMLKKKEMSFKEMSEELHLSSAIVTKHIQTLEEAGIVSSRSISGKRGLKKMCSLQINEAQIIFDNNYGEKKRSFIQVDIPISAYDRCEVFAPCGMAEADKLFGRIDDPRYFKASNRNRVSLLWFSVGYLEYPIPLFDVDLSEIKEIEISMEVCSEYPGFNSRHLSDLTFSINGIEVGSWTSPGDFGDRKGKYTPAWWSLGTEYGLKKTLVLKEEGVYIDHEKISDVALSTLIKAQKDPEILRFKIESNKDAKHPGGLNIFGRQFGDYDQDIEVRFMRKEKQKEHENRYDQPPVK